jgi:hypothetical protein
MEAIGVVSEVFSHVWIGWLLSLQSTVGLVSRRHALTTIRTLALLLLSPLSCYATGRADRANAITPSRGAGSPRRLSLSEPKGRAHSRSYRTKTTTG